MATEGPISIAATGDDGYEENFTGFTTNGLFVGNSGGGNEESIGLRFLSVDVPQGATINSATFSLLGRSLVGTVTNVHGTIRGVAQDNFAGYDASNRPSNLSKTTASTDFDPVAWVDGVRYSYDVTTSVAEIIARGGWVSGNAMGIVVEDDASTSNNYVRAYDQGDGSGTAQLTIDYTAGGASAFPHHYYQQMHRR